MESILSEIRVFMTSEEVHEAARRSLVQQAIQTGSFQRFLDYVNSNEFDSVVNFDHPVSSYLNDEMAQALGVVLLANQARISRLVLPIGFLSNDVTKYPALLTYLRTATLEAVVMLGDPELGLKFSPASTREVLHVLLSHMVMQDRPLPSLAIQAISLSPKSMACLQSFDQTISFVDCEFNEENNENPTIASWSARSLEFSRSSAPLMDASRNWIPQGGVCSDVHVIFDPTAPDHNERVEAAIQLVKSQQDRNVKLGIQLSNVDTDGSSVVGIMSELSSHFKLVVKFDWKEGAAFNEHAIRSRAEEIVEAASDCRFLRFDAIIRREESIFDDLQLDTVNKLCAVNRWLPHNVDTQPEEFWMDNLLLLQQLLTPEYLLHPRFQGVFFRLLRNNFNVFDTIWSWHRAPSSAPETSHNGPPEPEA